MARRLRVVSRSGPELRATTCRYRHDGHWRQRPQNGAVDVCGGPRRVRVAPSLARRAFPAAPL